MARDITASIVKHVGADPAVTWVVFEEIPQPQWYLAGRQFKGRWAAPPAARTRTTQRRRH